jgi:MFS transporter, DHA1 family, multidrug resistance protein
LDRLPPGIADLPLWCDLTTLPQACTENYWLFTAQRFDVGLFIGGLLPTANALVGRLVPRAERGTIFDITASATFLGNSLGPLTGGAVAAAFGLRWVFLVTAAVLLVNLLWVYYKVDDEHVLRSVTQANHSDFKSPE